MFDTLALGPPDQGDTPPTPAPEPGLAGALLYFRHLEEEKHPTLDVPELTTDIPCDEVTPEGFICTKVAGHADAHNHPDTA